MDSSISVDEASPAARMVSSWPTGKTTMGWTGEAVAVIGSVLLVEVLGDVGGVLDDEVLSADGEDGGARVVRETEGERRVVEEVVLVVFEVLRAGQDSCTHVVLADGEHHGDVAGQTRVGLEDGTHLVGPQRQRVALVQIGRAHVGAGAVAGVDPVGSGDEPMDELGGLLDVGLGGVVEGDGDEGGGGHGGHAPVWSG